MSDHKVYKTVDRDVAMMIEGLKQENQRLRGLLEICEEDMERCPVCLQLLIPVGEHDVLCKLEKELGDGT